MKKPSNAVSKPKKILSFDKIVIYSLGIFGIQLLVGYINGYQSQFYLNVFGVDESGLTLIAFIILIAKIISSFADSFIGNIIDASHFKSGKMKPFVAMSILPFAILTTLMFVEFKFPNKTVMYVYITVTTVLWNIAMSFADIPSQGMLAVLSPSSEEKNDCAGISNMLKSLALVAPGAVVPLICGLLGSATINAKCFLVSAIAMSVVAILLTLVMIKGSKEVVTSEPTKMSIKEMFRELTDNKPLMIIFLLNMLGFGRNMAVSIGVQASAVLLDSVTIGGITLAGENLPIIMGIGAAIPSTLSVVLCPVISKKFGVKKTYLAFGIYGTVVATVIFLLFCFGPAWFHSFWGIIFGQFVLNFMFGPHSFAPLVMLSDAVDYREMTTGKRTEGVQYSVLSLSIKLSNAFSVAVGIFIVALSGYTGNLAYADISDHTRNIVMVAYWLIPGICTGLSMIPLLFYKLDNPEIKAQIKAFIQKRDEVKS